MHIIAIILCNYPTDFGTVRFFHSFEQFELFMMLTLADRPASYGHDIRLKLFRIEKELLLITWLKEKLFSKFSCCINKTLFW